MGWSTESVYTIPAMLQTFDEKKLIFFDLNERKESNLPWGLTKSDLQAMSIEEI